MPRPRQTVGVQIHGLAEVRRGLRLIDPELQKEFRVEMKGVAEIIAADARSRVPSRSGKAAASIRARSGGNTVFIRAGGARVPYYGWLDFGGTLKPTGRRRNTIRRPKVQGGRFIYPAIEAKQTVLIQRAEQAFDKAKRKAGF